MYPRTYTHTQTYTQRFFFNMYAYYKTCFLLDKNLSTFKRYASADHLQLEYRLEHVCSHTVHSGSHRVRSLRSRHTIREYGIHYTLSAKERFLLSGSRNEPHSSRFARARFKRPEIVNTIDSRGQCRDEWSTNRNLKFHIFCKIFMKIF